MVFWEEKRLFQVRTALQELSEVWQEKAAAGMMGEGQVALHPQPDSEVTFLCFFPFKQQVLASPIRTFVSVIYQC